MKSEDPLHFEEALHTEIKQWLPQISPSLDTIFFGGGTPSMTAYDSIAKAMEPLWKRCSLHAQTEWTMEANPSSIELNALRSLRAYGVNRISLGVQAMQDPLLQALGRVHTSNKVHEALNVIFEAGFENVSVDLLCGVPSQSESDLESSLALVCQFPLTHLSCYLLTLPPHHRLYPDLPEEETQLKHLLLVDQFLQSKNFEHYEISNFARAGKKSEHNWRYWKRNSYLGLGPSAHSFDASTEKRWQNVASLRSYAHRLKEGKTSVQFSETLTFEQIELERWMLALRLNEGFPRSWLRLPHQKEKAEKLQASGLLEPHPHLEHERLTPRGLALADQIIPFLLA